MFARVRKANPFHGKDGRFSSSDSAHFVSVGGVFAGRDNDMSVSVGGSRLPVTLPLRAKKLGDSLVKVNVTAFDKAFSKNSDFYIGAGGEGQIRNRYHDFGKFVNGGIEKVKNVEFSLNRAPSMEASEVVVSKNGDVSFSNGRHRYAWLRDQKVRAIPVAMSAESKKNAKANNLLA